MEDKVTFEQAFQYHGKNFQRIRAMVSADIFFMVLHTHWKYWYSPSFPSALEAPFLNVIFICLPPHNQLFP